eukprot:scaffold4825_cov150-Skeletonema_dohrnii-CCMP3373.AAC.1
MMRTHISHRCGANITLETKVNHQQNISEGGDMQRQDHPRREFNRNNHGQSSKYPSDVYETDFISPTSRHTVKQKPPAVPSTHTDNNPYDPLASMTEPDDDAGVVSPALMDMFKQHDEALNTLMQSIKATNDNVAKTNDNVTKLSERVENISQLMSNNNNLSPLRKLSMTLRTHLMVKRKEAMVATHHTGVVRVISRRNVLDSVSRGVMFMMNSRGSVLVKGSILVKGSHNGLSMRRQFECLGLQDGNINLKDLEGQKWYNLPFTDVTRRQRTLDVFEQVYFSPRPTYGADPNMHQSNLGHRSMSTNTPPPPPSQSFSSTHHGYNVPPSPTGSQASYRSNPTQRQSSTHPGYNMPTSLNGSKISRHSAPTRVASIPPITSRGVPGGGLYNHFGGAQSNNRASNNNGGGGTGHNGVPHGVNGNFGASHGGGGNGHNGASQGNGGHGHFGVSHSSGGFSSASLRYIRNQQELDAYGATLPQSTLVSMLDGPTQICMRGCLNGGTVECGVYTLQDVDLEKDLGVTSLSTRNLMITQHATIQQSGVDSSTGRLAGPSLAKALAYYDLPSIDTWDNHRPSGPRIDCVKRNSGVLEVPSILW